MRRVVAMLFAFAAVAVVAPSGQAADVLVLRANRSGWVDVPVPKAFQMDIWSTQVESAGRYAGFVAQRAGQPYGFDSDHFGMVYAQRNLRTRVTAATQRWSTGFLPPEAAQFAAGTYRFYVVTERPVVIRVRIPGVARRVDISSRQPLKTSFATTDPVVHAPRYETRTGFTATARTAAVALGYYEWDGYQSYVQQLCFAPAGEACAPLMTGGEKVHADTDAQDGTGLFAGPGELTPGKWDAVTQVVTNADNCRIVGYLVSFETPA